MVSVAVVGLVVLKGENGNGYKIVRPCGHSPPWSGGFLRDRLRDHDRVRDRVQRDGG